MKTHPSRYRPYPFIPELTEGGVSLHLARQPRLHAKWTMGLDGKLTCRWGTEL